MKSPDNRPLRISALKAIKFGSSKAAFHRLATPEKVLEMLDRLDELEQFHAMHTKLGEAILARHAEEKAKT